MANKINCPNNSNRVAQVDCRQYVRSAWRVYLDQCMRWLQCVVLCSNLTLAGGEWRAGGQGPAPLLDLDSAVCPLLAADRPQSSPGFRETSVTIQYKLEKNRKAAATAFLYDTQRVDVLIS